MNFLTNLLKEIYLLFKAERGFREAPDNLTKEEAMQLLKDYLNLPDHEPVKTSQATPRKETS